MSVFLISKLVSVAEETGLCPLLSETSKTVFLHQSPSCCSSSFLSGSFSWTDNTAVNYLNWNPGQPTGIGTHGQLEECVEINRVTGKWNDLSCFTNRGYVCKALKGMLIYFIHFDQLFKFSTLHLFQMQKHFSSANQITPGREVIKTFYHTQKS